MRQSIWFLLSLTLFAVPCLASTWHVELDGSGDFTVIQDAVDAAAAGDTIYVGPGRFDTRRPIPGWDDFQSTVSIQKNRMVVIGSGADQTILGADTVYWDYRCIAVIESAETVDSFYIRDVAIVGGYDGIHYERDGLDVQSCEFANSSSGISVFGSRDCSIRDSYFHDHVIPVISYSSNENIGIYNCRVERAEIGLAMQGVVDAVIRDCVITECQSGFQFVGSTGSISNCQVAGIPGEEFGGGGWFTEGSVVEMSDCTIDYSMTDTYSAMDVRNWAIVSGQRNEIRGGGHTTLRVHGQAHLEGFFSNSIYKAEDYALVANYYNPSLTGPLVTMNLTNNYWGTEDASLIEAWIDDAQDHPDNLDYWMIVDYSPYFSESVPTEDASWGDVKAMYLGER